jgi:DNA-binding transcriptional MerR regulator
VTTRDDTDDQSFFEEDAVGLATHEDDGVRSRSVVKSSSAFRTISEVSAELDVPQHVLRFWESKFTQLRPLKRGGGRRYYRPEDLALLRRIHELLYKDGYTIKGVQRVLRSPRKAAAQEEVAPQPAAPQSASSQSASSQSAASQSAASQSAALHSAEPAAQGAVDTKPQSRSAEQVLRELLKDLKSLRATLD